MNVFFEESGSFKAGSVLSRQGDAFQVELPGGRRAKVRAKDVLIEFEKPAASELLEQADAAAQEIDLDFLWECAPAEEFAYTALASEYFGQTYGPVERAALVLRLHGSPVYFRRKGRGQYQRAPEEQLKMALASLERKRQQALVQAGYEEELKAGRLPEAFKGRALGLLTKPDKNSIEYKALEAAAAARGISMPRLMLENGGIASPRALHEARFLADFFPHGTGFPPVEVGTLPEDLPAAAEHVQAFSIDDVTTTEIDDAFSIEHLADGRVRIGIHIAAPALGIRRGDTADTIARTRLSTVYMPGDKITMLPDDFVDAFTLKEGGLRPALSLYCIVNRETQEIVATETRAERVFVKSNLRHNTLDEVVTEETLAAGTGEYPHKDDIAVLWPFAQALFEKRQQARAGYGLRREVQRNTDFNFYVEGEHVTISPRRRGSPLDLIVAELAILANSTWGAFLHDHGVPGIYRSQRAFGAPSGPKRTRMQTSAAPHEGLGVAQYAWSTSPLRRYVDLVNQWQLLACVEHGVAAKLVAPFKPKDADLFAVVQGFDETYTAYADHQRRMEYFWCLRWLQQEMRGEAGREPRREFPASVVKDDLVRFEEVPLLMHVPALGVHARGTRLMMEVLSIDELTIEASVRMLRVLDAPVVTSGEQPEEDAGEDEELIEAADESAQSEAEAVAEAGEAQGEAASEASAAEEQSSEQHATEPRG
ncbi:ribonuclease catalytic domain-containing protein [Paraburkholderia silvatlantica]|uniref:Exoribonuclease-2 n=1 Tax=Paraburkholderia silvatlantica TaxID=321895 RepID=A0A2U0ZRN2_9BURK|nr:RNB domain-containing ribonuclease [Paraburkholderia silvatlantica]MBB2932611.1 exoribonuclease-2 [Paraburkholderia silvatlantica]PVY21555.1 exoribonuclease-2 [Paraburkholderia silvatlantica]PXW26795.1 exoribonuclease-2 [Paraburkholderia silvatlantica]PYE14201.1 exoribonuclease-2 [Paraburkholderia silvatlantica]